MWRYSRERFHSSRTSAATVEHRDTFCNFLRKIEPLNRVNFSPDIAMGAQSENAVYRIVYTLGNEKWVTSD